MFSQVWTRWHQLFHHRSFSTSSSDSYDAPLRVAVALSGGVDSSVTAYLLKKAGHEVVGVHMSNWSEQEERGYCTGEEDKKEAQRVAQYLDIPLKFVEFEREYWNFVFEPAIAQYGSGNSTPSPDVSCNREIKFSRLLTYALEVMGSDMLATGHYARLRRRPSSFDSNGTVDISDRENDPTAKLPYRNGETVDLLCGIDQGKDQTYFLHQVHARALSHVLFPLGEYTKKQVREIAADVGLPNSVRKDSVGICFIGKRKFSDFLEEYIPHSHGPIVDLEGKVVGQHLGLPFYTIGQNARVSGASTKLFVVAKNVSTNTLVVCNDTNHPFLFSSFLYAVQPRWVSGIPPPPLGQGQSLQLQAGIRHLGRLYSCEVRLVDTPLPFLEVEFASPVRGVAPGQMIVFYDGEVCLGGAEIAPDLHPPSINLATPETERGATKGEE